MDYRYAGPGPHEDPELGLIRPGDVRQFDEEPDWGPWERAGRPASSHGGDEPPSPTGASPSAPGAAPAPGLTTAPPPLTPREF